MQLFISDFILKWNYIDINDLEIIKKMNNVLRVKPWYNFLLQNYFKIWSSIDIINRYHLELTSISNSLITAKILNIEEKKFNLKNTWFFVPILNNFDKMDLIVQKLTEIWIENIIFWFSENSQISDISENKMSRFYKISKEAVQQSKWFFIPNIQFIKTININSFNFDKLIIFDFWWKNINEFLNENLLFNNIYWIIWPEWWFWKSDYLLFWDIENKFTVNLWENILRSETWTIIWSWLLSNL